MKDFDSAMKEAGFFLLGALTLSVAMLAGAKALLMGA